MNTYSLRRASTITTFGLLALLSACSGSGNSTPGAGSGAAETVVLIDTSSTTDFALRATIVSAMFEDAAGNRSAPLLATPTSLLLADPAGTTEVLGLSAVAAGTWDALVLIYDSAQSLDPTGGATNLSPSFGSLRVAFDDRVTIRSSGLQVLRVRHAIAPATAGGLVTDLRAESATGSPVESMTVDVRAATSRASFGSGSTSDFQLEFESNADLSGPDGSSPDASSWLASFSSGDRADLDGVFLSDDRFRIRRGSRRGDDSCDQKVYGTITDVDLLALTIDVAVAFLRDDSRNTIPASGTRRFDIATARIFEDASSSVSVPRTTADLMIGQFVEVEFCPGTPDRAYEVEIEDGPGDDSRNPETEGRVVSIDLMSRTIQVAPRSDDPLIVGGISVSSAILDVPPSATLFRVFRGGRDPETIALDQVSSSDRIWFRGSVTGPQRVLADWVRVRDESDR